MAETQKTEKKINKNRENRKIEKKTKTYPKVLH